MQDKLRSLLDTAANEIEIVEFMIGNTSYGIDVGQVREIVNDMPVTELAGVSDYIDGVFSLRGKVMPVVNLARYLSSTREVPETQKIIICEINGIFTGFKVDEVTGIPRISRNQLDSIPDIAGSDMVVGVAKMEEKLIILVDFEKIILEINQGMTEAASIG